MWVSWKRYRTTEKVISEASEASRDWFIIDDPNDAWLEQQWRIDGEVGKVVTSSPPSQ